MSRNVCLDLFAGLGGFSQAFEDSGEWDVYTVDIEERFEPDICADVLDLRTSDLAELVGGLDIDGTFVVLASPPCVQFSPAGNHDNWDFEREEPTAPESREAVLLAHHTVGLVESLTPDYWFLENPRGRMRWVLGQPQGTVTYCRYGKDYMKPTDLWGDHPRWFAYKSCGIGDDCHVTNRDDDGTPATASMPSDSAERAKVPHELSESIREAVEKEERQSRIGGNSAW